MMLYADTTSNIAEIRVLKIKFLGIENLSRKKLSRYLLVESSPRWKFWRQDKSSTIADIQDDVYQIKQFYQNAGYYHTVVSYELDFVKGGENITSQNEFLQGELKQIYNSSDRIPEVKLIYSIHEGEPVLIRSITLAMTPEIVDIPKEFLTDHIPLKTGEIFETANYDESKKLITKAFRNKGYLKVDLVGAVKINSDRNEATVTFTISPGVKWHFGDITFSGNNHVVREKTLSRTTTFMAGEIYSEQKVDDSLRNLFNLDVFRTVSIVPGQEQPGITIKPVTFKVEPKKRQSVSLSLGYGSEDGPRSSGIWTYRNAFSWAGKFSVKTKVSDLIQNAEAEYVQPYFWDSSSSMRYNAGYERETLESHTNRKLFTHIIINKKFRKIWAWNFGYNLEVNDLEEFNIDDPEELSRFNDNDNFLISSLAGGIVRDSRENVLNPTKGTLLKLALEYGSNITGSEVDFLTPSIEVSHHQSLTKTISLAGRIRVESIQDIENTESIPIFKRLFLGGGSTVRGYGFQKLGPIDKDDDPIGGQSSLYANVEIRYPIYKKLAGVVFLDMGFIDEAPFTYKLKDLLYSSGVGVRYETVIGPLRLDFGYKLNPPKRGDFGLTDDANEEVEGRWKIHINIGHAF